MIKRLLEIPYNRRMSLVCIGIFAIVLAGQIV